MVAGSGSMSPMTDPSELWDFDDPAGSEQRFRAAAETAEGSDRLVLLTQVARSLGLQERYDEGHALLDDLAVDNPEVATRVALERGRLLRSAGEPDEAGPHFDAAAVTAREAGLDALHVDALHMAALVAPAEDQQRRTEEALAVARASSDEAARNWDASLLNNLGMTHADAGDWPAALAAFEEALAARERIGDAGRTRVARWMVGWALRNLGRTDEALAVQTALKAELEAVGEEDPYVDEELALLDG
jgi:tetratricopeptide (TPR) repeat protein